MRWMTISHAPCFDHVTYNPASQMTHRQDRSLPSDHNWGIECQARV